MRSFLSVAALVVAGTPRLLGEALLLGGFESEDEILVGWSERPTRWRPSGVEVKRSVEHVTEGVWSLKCVFKGSDQRSWPSLAIVPKEPDWTKFSALRLDVFNVEKTEVLLWFRIDMPDQEDPKQTLSGWPRAPLAPGRMTAVQVPIEKLPSVGAASAANVAMLLIYLESPKADTMLYFDNIRLVTEETAAAPQSPGPLEPSGILARERGAVRARRLSVPPKLDGDLTDACWREATKVSGFVDIQGQATIREQTAACIGYTDEALYFAFECLESQMDALRMASAKHDGAVFSDDCVEILLDPDANGRGYYHFVLNPAGMQQEERFSESRDMEIAWSPRWQAGAARGKDRWTAEVALPFAILEVNERVGSTWRFDLCREERPRGELSCLFPTYSGFHVPEKWGCLEGIGANLTRFRCGLSNMTFREPLFGTNRVSAIASNSTGQQLRALARLEIVAPSGKRAFTVRPIALAAGSKQSVELTYAVHDRGSHVAYLSLLDRATNRLLHESSAFSLTPPAPLRLTLLEPSYGGRIFSDERVDQIRARALLNVEEGVRRGATLRTTLTREGRLLAERFFRSPRPRTEFVLPATRLPAGDYRLTATLLNASNRSVVATSTLLRKLPPRQNEVRVDRANRLLFNGKPFFPIGIFQGIGVETLPELEEAGFNTIQQYTWVGDDERVKQMLDACREHGLKMVLEVHRPYVYGESDKKTRDSYLRERCTRFGQHPALLCWYLADEPDYLDPALIKESYDVLCGADPYHPVSIVLMTANPDKAFAPACDIMMHDPYPDFRGSGPVTPLSYIGGMVDQARRALGGKKPVWIVPQIHDVSAYDLARTRGRAPNYREIRCETYVALTHGALGILFYNYRATDDTTNHPGTWLGARRVAKELSVMQDVLLAPHGQPAAKAKPISTDLHVSARRLAGHLFLLTVNSGGTRLEARISLPAVFARTGALHVWGERRRALVHDNVLSDVFEPYAVHVYAEKPEPPGFPAVAETEQQCREADEARKKDRWPNLVSRDGVEVAASSQASRDWFAVDGSRFTAWRDETADKFPDWFEVRLPEVHVIKRLVLQSDLTDFRILVRQGDQWREVRSVKGNDQDRLTLNFDPPLSAARLRIEPRRSRSGYSNIAELELYE